MHRRALATVEQAKLDTGRINCLAHDPAEGVYLPHDLSLRDTANRRIATHLRNTIDVGRQ